MLSIQIDCRVSDENIRQICQEYWDCDQEGVFRFKVAQIAQKHGMKTNEVSAAVYDGCDAYSEDYVCAKCGKPFIFNNRTSYMQIARNPRKTDLCSSCREKEFVAMNARREAEYVALKEKQDAERQAHATAIKVMYSLQSCVEPDIYDLSLKDVVYLLSFIRAMYTQDLTTYGPAIASVSRIAPTGQYRSSIINHLHEKRLIRVNPDSPIDAFIFEDGNPNTFYTYKVKWTLATGNDIEKTRRFIHRIQSVLENPELRPFDWNDQILPLWREIAFYECLEYLEKTMDEYQFPFNQGEKVKLVFETLVLYRSVSEVYNFIYSAVRNAAAFQKRTQIPDSHAANIVPGNIQAYSERARAEGWERKKYKRDFDCPQTIISQVTFNLALKIGEAGFDEVPYAVIVKNHDVSSDETNLEGRLENSEQ